MAWAPGCGTLGWPGSWALRSYRGPGQALFLAPATLLLWGLPGTRAGREHTLHKPLHSEEIHGVGVRTHDSQQVQSEEWKKTAHQAGWGMRGG